MPSTIVTKNSSTASAVPVTGDLTQGELAVNVTDKKLYTKDSGGTVVKIVGGLGNQEANAVAITGGSINGTTVGATTASTGAFTTLSASSTVSGTGFSTYLASPPAIGGTAAAAGSFTTLSASGNTTLSGGTANGVAYLNGSKVVTTGSALTFDGTNLGVLAGSVTSPAAKIHAVGSVRASTGAGTVYSQLASDGVYSTGTDLYLFAPTGYSNIFYANNSEGMRLTSTGLGIGATSPGVKLDVRGATGNGIRWLETSSGNTTRIQLGTAAGLGYIDADAGSGSIALGFRVGGANLMTLDSSGNLGLGVTPTGKSKFEVYTGAGSFNGVQVQYNASNAPIVLACDNSNGDGYIGQNTVQVSGTGGQTYAITNYATKLRMHGGAFSFYTAPSGTAGNAITFTQAMTLDASGNLGVGVTSVTAPGASRQGIQVASAAGGAVLLGQSATATNNARVIGANSGAELLLAGGAGNPVTIYTDGAERARIDSSGRLLLGTTSATIGAVTCAVALDATTVNSGFGMGINGNASNTQVMRFAYAGTAVGSISITSSTTAYNTSSDYRLKDNQQPLTGSGAFIDALKPKTWEWKADGSKGVGFIAHEVQEVSPGSVIGAKDAVDEEGNPIMQAMEYGSAEFIANIVAELQSLRQRVAQLEGK